ncbi:MAG: 4Fe-4S binding protein [Deltaproteobacteria bacterium]|nr:4Fe-4S binding protein [Deltaproteobacteria bacterium]
MPDIDIDAPGKIVLLMGNEAIARGALEAGVMVATSYPGTPTSEILPSIADVAERRNIYAEWSVNEMVAMMVAAGACFGGVRAMSSMKQNGTNVALDFISTLVMRGLRKGGGLVLINSDDPGHRNSPNEQDTRTVAKWLDIPMLEPGDFQEAKDMTKWLFELSEELDTICMLRCVSKISHARGNVTLGELPQIQPKPHLPLNLSMWGGGPPHAVLHGKMDRAREIFESSPFNKYVGPDKAELLIITCGSGWLHSQEAVRLMGLSDRVGILKLGTLSPLPEKLIEKHLEKSEKVLFMEETDPFVEQSVMEFFAGLPAEKRTNVFYGKRSGHVPAYGEINPDLAIKAIADLTGETYVSRDPAYSEKAETGSQRDVIPRSGALCAGCPHRASFWAMKTALKLDGRDGFVTADNGCNGASVGPNGFFIAKTILTMGSGAGVADGLGVLGRFGFDQPVIGGVGDSTFYHACMPVLLNGVWNKSNFTLVVYDNSATAMTGWQPHPGTGTTAMKQQSTVVEIESICQAMGVRIEICDPFDLKATTETMLDVIRDEDNGPRVVIMRRECELTRARREKPRFEVMVNPDLCMGDECGCDRLCSRVFRCPGLRWDEAAGKSVIDEILCAGCGVCVDICPAGAIEKVALQPNADNRIQEVQ